MAIKVVFPTNQKLVTVEGLYQWDYGQVLEIESPDLGSVLGEVHFACTDMTEAIVRSCSFSNGVGTVTIPDQCLEHTSPINAWIYLIHDTQGYTVKQMYIPINARPRPARTRDIPQEFVNVYTEAITEINEAVNAIENGDVTAANAIAAERANYAASAGNASTANVALSAKNFDGKYYVHNYYFTFPLFTSAKFDVKLGYLTLYLVVTKHTDVVTVPTNFTERLLPFDAGGVITHHMPSCFHPIGGSGDKCPIEVEVSAGNDSWEFSMTYADGTITNAYSTGEYGHGYSAMQV